MARAGMRIAVVGATGAVGAELIEALAASSIRVAQIVPVATERSLGTEIEFQGEDYPVEAELPRLRGFDFVFLCAPRAASLHAAREALRAAVPGIDLSGALAPTAEVPLQIADLGIPEDEALASFVATPAGPALACALVLRPLAERVGLLRVQATVLDSASAAGVRGAESLLSESIAIFSQQDPPDPTVFSRQVAFDCGPAPGPPGADGDTAREQETAADLRRVLGAGIGFSVATVQVPTFLGLGVSLSIAAREPIDPDEARVLLAKAPGVQVWPDELGGPSLRAAAGRPEVLVGRVRRDPSAENGLLLWIAADPVCLSAANAVKLAEARLTQAPRRSS